MKTISRYIMTLALLITAVTGAWADEELTETIITTGYSGSNLTVNGTYFKVSGTQFRSDGGYNGVRIANGKTATISLIDPNSSAKATKIVLYPDGGDTDVQYAKIDGAGTYSSTDVTVSKDVSITNDGSATISWGGNVNYGVSISKIEITYTAGPVVNINDAKTEASFTMPAFDATAEYELVRDMSIQMTATMGDGTDGVRYRVKKAQQGQGYEPADLNMMQVLALVAVNDGIEQKALTLNQDYYCRIYKLDEQTLQPEGDGVKLTDFDFAPGLYALKAFAKDGSDYAGETALSNTFKLFQGYEVEVPAKEFITYYKDEPLYVEDEDAKLYTITAVDETAATATLSDAMTVTPANTPLLVFNSSEETKTFLLIPTTDEADNVTAADEFKGTLEATQIAASTTTQNNYAFNGKAFVWVKNDIAIAANKAWLEIGSGAAGARSVVLVFSDSLTGVNLTPALSEGEGTWYDLSGRKLQGKPTKSGVYINNGKKVTIK